MRREEKWKEEWKGREIQKMTKKKNWIAHGICESNWS